MPPTPFTDRHVRAAFDAHPPEIRARLLALREWVFETADEADGVGPIEEALALTHRLRSRGS